MAKQPQMANLDVLVGEWAMEAGPPEGPPWPGEGRVSFEWLNGGSWLIERWHVDMPEAPNGIAIIGPKDAPAVGGAYATSGELLQHYFDTRGVHRIYEMSLANGVWKLWRQGEPFSQRFTGTVSKDGKTIKGRWEINESGDLADRLRPHVSKSRLVRSPTSSTRTRCLACTGFLSSGGISSGIKKHCGGQHSQRSGLLQGKRTGADN